MTNNDFEFKYTGTSKEEKKEIESIRNKYITKQEVSQDLAYLKKLDNKVNNIPVMIALILGIGGLLIFGLGLAMILEWNIMLWGIIVSCIGLIPILLAYPSFIKTTAYLKNKYGEEILRISNDLLKK